MNTSTAAAACLVCLAAGFVAGTSITRKPSPRQEPPAPAIFHEDGSITLERTNEPPPEPLPEPPGTVTRTRAATIELDPIPQRSTIQLDLVTLKDGTQRITAKGQGIIGGTDFAIGPPAPVKKWTVGATWNGKALGLMALKSFGPIQIGITANREQAGAVLAFQF